MGCQRKTKLGLSLAGALLSTIYTPVAFSDGDHRYTGDNIVNISGSVCKLSGSHTSSDNYWVNGNSAVFFNSDKESISFICPLPMRAINGYEQSEDLNLSSVKEVSIKVRSAYGPIDVEGQWLVCDAFAYTGYRPDFTSGGRRAFEVKEGQSYTQTWSAPFSRVRDSRALSYGIICDIENTLEVVSIEMTLGGEH